MTYQWYRNGVAIAGATNEIFFRASATVQDTGVYRALVTDPRGPTALWGPSQTVQFVLPTEDLLLRGFGNGTWETKAWEQLTPNYLIPPFAVYTNSLEILNFSGARRYQEGRYSSEVRREAQTTRKLYLRNGFHCKFHWQVRQILGSGFHSLTFGFQNQTNRVICSSSDLGVYSGPSLLEDREFFYELDFDGASIQIRVDGRLTTSALVSGSLDRNGGSGGLDLSTGIDERGYGSLFFESHVYSSGSNYYGDLARITDFEFTANPPDENVSIVLSGTGGFLPGGSSSVLVAIGGPGNMSYQWQFNGVNIAGAIHPSLLLSNIQPANAGTYSVFLTNELGVASSATRIVPVRMPIGSLYNTGVDSNHVWLSNDVIDPHYVVTTLGGLLGHPFVKSDRKDAYFPSSWSWPDPTSAWIAPWTNGVLIGRQSPGPMRYEYTTTFDLTGLDYRTAAISGYWNTDDAGLDILINGLSTGQKEASALNGNPVGSTAMQFAIRSGFVPGVNTLTFVVTNAATYFATGLRVGMSGTALVSGFDLALDSDGNGLPDLWESEHLNGAYGLDVNSDSDGDGVSNRDEYAEGTDPSDAQSFRPRIKSVGLDWQLVRQPAQKGYVKGSLISLTALPKAGGVFLRWGGDLSGTQNPVTLPITSNMTVTVTLARPYEGFAKAFPGIIQAEDFDEEGEGRSYHDNDLANNGGALYRRSAVDIRPGGTGYVVGWSDTAEWLSYTVSVSSNGFYRAVLRAASGSSGGIGRLDFSGGSQSNMVAVPGTGGWDNWTNLASKFFYLQAGIQALRFTCQTASFDLDFIEVVAATNTPPTVKLTNPAPGMNLIAGFILPLGVDAVDSDGLVSTVEYFVNGSFVALSTSPPFSSTWPIPSAGVYTVYARATDNLGLSSNSAPVSVSALPLGMLKREVYTGIVGTNLASLTNHAKFPNSPDLVARVFQLELPPNWGDNYGARLSGYLVPPISGAYVFYLASDDEGALFLSTDESPAHKVRIASEPQWNGYREYIKGANQASRGNPPSNISAPILLSAGHSYYIEALMKEGTGGDNLSVAWKLPGGAAPTNGSAPIATYLQLNSDTVPTVSCVSPPSGLVGWWRGQNNALDSASTNHGALKNGATFAPGFVGQAFSFDGPGQFVSTDEGALTSVSNTFTVEFWVNPTASRNVTAETSTGTAGTSGQRYAIFPRYGGTVDAGMGVSVGTNGISVFEHGGGYLPSTLVYQAPIFGWNHIAVVYLNKQPSLYLNGVWVRTGMTSPRAAVHPSPQFGGDTSPYGYFAGLVDEPSIYNRSLSPAEIEDLYAAGGQGKCKPTLQILTSDGSFGFINGQFSFRVMGGPGQVIIEATSDLQNWTPIRTNTVGIEPFLFRDIDPAQYPFRYYRAVMP